MNLLSVHYGKLHWTEHVRARLRTLDEITTLHAADNAPRVYPRRQ